MKMVANISYLIEALGIKEAINTLKTAGFDACDYGFYTEFDHEKLLEDGYAEYYKKLRTITDELGFECAQAHAPFVLRCGEPYSVDTKGYLMIIRAIECAAILGAENIIVHPLETPDAEDEHTVNLNYFKSLQPYAERYGIRIAVENCYNDDVKRKRFLGRIGTPEKMNRLLDELASDVFVMCLDVGHAAITGTEPEDYIRGMSSERLRALHIHDTDYLDDTHTVPFLGKHNWNEICKALGEIGYTGAFTFEDIIFMRAFEPELLGDVMNFEAKIGRSLINKIEKATKGE